MKVTILFVNTFIKSRDFNISSRIWLIRIVNNSLIILFLLSVAIIYLILFVIKTRQKVYSFIREEVKKFYVKISFIWESPPLFGIGDNLV